MGNDLRLSNNAASVEADALKVRFNNGYCDVYTAPRPATPDDAPAGATLLATLRFAATAYASQVNGLITMNPLTSDLSADAGGVAAWYRSRESDGTTPIADGTCGVTGGGFDMEMPTTTIVAGQEVRCSSFTHTVRKT